MTPDICIYHGNCADGFTAAWAVFKRFGEEVEYIPGVYGEAPPDVTGKNVIIVDFSYKRAVLEEMSKRAASILILDHHKTAEEDLATGGKFLTLSGHVTWERHLNNLAQDDMENANISGAIIYSVFDMERSGAGITWDVLHPGAKRPALVDYVEDRDLWKFEIKSSREVNAFVFAHEYTFDNWDLLNAKTVAAMRDAGAAIEKKHHKDVAELVAKLRRPMVIAGQKVPVANLPYTLTSDAGHLMCTEPFDGYRAPFAACYWDTPDGRVFSLRSTEGGYDVSKVAAKYGGGGHKHAAGFQVPIGWEGEAAGCEP